MYRSNSVVSFTFVPLLGAYLYAGLGYISNVIVNNCNSNDNMPNNSKVIIS